MVVIGDALIDEIRDAAGVRELVGGAALNVAVGLRRLGVPATLIAMVGADAAGDHIREYLADHDVPLIDSPSEHGSSRAVVHWSPQGEPEYTFNEAAQRRSIRFSDDALDAITDAALIAISCFPFDSAAEVAALTDAVADSHLVIDPNPRAGMLRDRAEFVRGFEGLAARAELVKVGADDAVLLYDGDLDALRRRLRDLGAGAVLATAGADGAVLESDSGEFAAPIVALPGRVVDTVGAGDATMAAVVEGLLDGHPTTDAGWRALLDRAMAVAAATVRAEGGLLRTPESLAAGDHGLYGS
ncbi:carbohydrate kinase [Microbacterium soli]|uniref:Carbohydrate kinase n=1 Tax=Microbacterium soli TaxID=446075 RepID=A0ABP7MW57_9MICO